MSSPSEQVEQSKSKPTLPQVFLSTRPPVTEHEANTVDKILEALIESETFYLSGTLDLTTLDVSNPTLFYSVNDQNGDVQASRYARLMLPLLIPFKPLFSLYDSKGLYRYASLPQRRLDLLHADADPSPFGHNKELVLDESYRLAREIRSDRFGLNFDPTSVGAGVLAAVSAFVAPHLDPSDPNASQNDIHPHFREPELVHRKTGVQATLYKLNSYTTGGHFKKHQDTPKAENHIGTLLFGLPTSFSGGELVLTDLSEDSEHDSKAGDVKIDWSKSSSSPLHLSWVFFYSDVEHEILPVSSGHRLTIAYDIFTTDTVRYRVPSNPDKIDTRSMGLFNMLNDSLKDDQFLNKGGKLAFALTYQYPARELELAKKVAFDAILKGNDYLLFHTLKGLSLAPEVRAVYQPEEFPNHYQNDRLKELTDTGKTRYPVDRFSSFRARPPSRRPGYHPEDNEDVVFFTAPTFMGIDSSRCESDDEPRIQLLTECTRASVDWELIWVKRPTVAAWAKASTFAYYGNEPDTAYTYVAGVLVVDVPGVGAGARKRPE